MFQRIRRREFIAGLGGAAILPLLVHAQHPGKLPTIGYLGTASRLGVNSPGKVKQFTQP
jgi:hypothetical protein